MSKSTNGTPNDPQDHNSPDREHNALVERVLDPASNLDAESHQVVRTVLYRDTEDAREDLARAFTAEARTDHRRLKHEQKGVGTWEQMQAIWRTGACPDARFWFIAAWCFVLIDAVFWFIATAQAFAF